MENAEVWTKGNRMRVFGIIKSREDLDRTVTIAHAQFPDLERDLATHGKGCIRTALAGYTGITNYTRQFDGPRARIQEEIEAFQKRARRAGFKRKGVVRLS